MLWLCFTTAIVTGEYVVLTKQQEQTLVSPAVTELVSALPVAEAVEQTKQVEEQPAPDPKAIEESYSKGYTEGYHKATEQLNCPAHYHLPR